MTRADAGHSAADFKRSADMEKEDTRCLVTSATLTLRQTKLS